MEPLHKDFREFLESLVSHQVKFMIIGGYAVAWHGRARNTDDIDIWIDASFDNVQLTINCLNDFFGEGFIEMTPERFVETQCKHIGNPPWRIDILCRIDGVEFHEAFPNHELWPIGENKFPIISLPDLRKAKAATGRTKDLADLADFLPPNNE